MEQIDYTSFDKAIEELEKQVIELRLRNIEIQATLRKMQEVEDEYLNSMYGYMAVNNN